MLVLAGTAFGSALLEAMFLVVLTGVAMSLVNGQGQVGPMLGRTFTYQIALGAAAGLLAMRLCLNLLEVRASGGLAADVVSETRRRLSLAYLGTSWTTKSAEPSGRLQEILTSFVDRAQGAAGNLAILLSSTLSLLAFLGSSLLVDPAYTLLVFVAVIAFGLLLGPLRSRVRVRSRAMARSNLEFANTVSELGSLGMEMQTYGVQGRFADRIRASTAVNTETRRRAQTLQLMTQPIYLFLAYGSIVLGVAVLTRAETADLQTFGAVLLLMMRSLSYGQNMQASLGALVGQVPFLRQIEDTVARYGDTAASGGSAVPASALPVEFLRVSFGYTGGRLALEAVDLRIGRGEILGVVGPSGAGKSTFAQLLLGLRDPSDGAVTVGGVDLRQVDRSWWTDHVAFVAQDARLITGTVAENIRFFRDEIDDERLRRAAREANLLAEIEDLPDGFGTHLGERGGQLSGGQRQRLSIARALAGDPEVLMLDEPTSALDAHSEALIKQTLEALRGDVTVVIIAHRMSLLDSCDRILVIEDGRITGLAAPADLRVSSSFYRGALAVAG